MSDPRKRQNVQIERDANGAPYYETWGFPESGGGWVKAPRDGLRDGRLDPASKIIWLLLVDECQRTQQKTIEYSYARLTLETGLVSHHTIRRKLDILVTHGFLEIDGDEPGTTMKTERFYTPTMPDEAGYLIQVTETYARRAGETPRARQILPKPVRPSEPDPPLASMFVPAESTATQADEGRDVLRKAPTKKEETADRSKTDQTVMEDHRMSGSSVPGEAGTPDSSLSREELMAFLQDPGLVDEYLRLEQQDGG